MIIYKHFEKEEYLKTWVNGSFVWTKISRFIEGKNTRFAQNDSLEGSCRASTENATLILENYDSVDIFSYLEEERVFRSLEENLRNSILISSFSLVTNEDLKKRFGSHVLKFDFDPGLMELGAKNSSLFFGAVSYGDAPHALEEVIDNAESDAIEDLKKRLLSKERQFSSEEEYRFIILINVKKIRTSSEVSNQNFYKWLMGGEKHLELPILKKLGLRVIE